MNTVSWMSDHSRLGGGIWIHRGMSVRMEVHRLPQKPGSQSKYFIICTKTYVILIYKLKTDNTKRKLENHGRDNFQ